MLPVSHEIDDNQTLARAGNDRAGVAVAASSGAHHARTWPAARWPALPRRRLAALPETELPALLFPLGWHR
jgi:hypothetical protein